MTFKELYELTEKQSFSKWFRNYISEFKNYINYDYSKEDWYARKTISDSVEAFNNLYKEELEFANSKLAEVKESKDTTFFDENSKMSFKNLLTNNNFLNNNSIIVKMNNFIPSKCYSLKVKISNFDDSNLMTKYRTMEKSSESIISKINKKNTQILYVNELLRQLKDFFDKTLFYFNKIKEQYPDWDAKLIEMFLGNSEYTIGTFAQREMYIEDRDYAVFVYEIIRDLTGTSTSSMLLNKLAYNTISTSDILSINKDIVINDGYITFNNLLSGYKFGKVYLPETIEDFKERLGD